MSAHTFDPIRYSAAQMGYARCPTCDMVSHIGYADEKSYCPRCGTTLYLRKSASVSTTWAFLIAACILYLPANLLPVMETTYLGATDYNTIMGGVVYMWTSGSWDLAILIFIASFVIPMSKLIALAVLLLSIQMRSTWRPLQRTRLYRAVEMIGKWSMLDVYVVSLMAALITFGSLMSIHVGLGAIAFGSVVVLTMFAAQSFDPRLIWDAVERDSAQKGDDDE
jgi:Uncharacterized paraquat-inducible protein A